MADARPTKTAIITGASSGKSILTIPVSKS